MLLNLGEKWNILAVMGQISKTGTDMSGTREGFQRLTSQLLHHLSLEMLKKAAQEMDSKAQVAVDVLIRNLFERTADIGFLATDDDIREFLRLAMSISLGEQFSSSGEEVTSEQEGREWEAASAAELLDKARTALYQRFSEYVAKYSVYFNIVLLDVSGCVLAQLSGDNLGFRSGDPLVQEALSTKAEYVEIFRYCDLLPDRDKSLIYAYRVTETNDPDSAPLGVLCLCFRFEDEMEGIFANLLNEGDWSVLLILDENGRVIASSDFYQIPLGAPVPMMIDSPHPVVRFGGREYLAKTCRTKGYQGFFGLGWLGHVMVPMDHAFETIQGRDLDSQINAFVLKSIMSAPRLFSDELRAIPKQADCIQEKLDLTVWNGNVHEAGANSKLVLQQISHAGAQTKQVFEDSISNLHKTVISSILNDAEFQATLAVDLMDRNLYERANDARWWALTSAFRRILAKPSLSDSGTKTIADILNYINCLYTVYTLLLVYDLKGQILAVSNATGESLVGSILDQEWVHRTLEIKDSQKYSVSRFDKTHLYQERHTYIYGASITHPDRAEAVVGGIGIVFDSEPQFMAMLEDSLPRDEQGLVQSGCFGIFADRDDMIISSTNPKYPVGTKLNSDRAFLSLGNGRSKSNIIEYEGQYYAVGACTSGGYREYKKADDYRNDVIGLVFVPLSEVREASSEIGKRHEIHMTPSRLAVGSTARQSVATFYIGQKCFAFKTEHVVESIHTGHITAIQAANTSIAGTIIYDGKLIQVFDISSELGCGGRKQSTDTTLAVVIEASGYHLAILVDALGEIAEVGADQMVSAAGVMGSSESCIECFINPGTTCRDHQMVVVLNPEKLLRYLG